MKTIENNRALNDLMAQAMNLRVKFEKFIACDADNLFGKNSPDKVKIKGANDELVSIICAIGECIGADLNNQALENSRYEKDSPDNIIE